MAIKFHEMAQSWHKVLRKAFTWVFLARFSLLIVEIDGTSSRVALVTPIIPISGTALSWNLFYKSHSKGHEYGFPCRGGDLGAEGDGLEEDSERYSRQLYVFGTRAQSLIRQSCVVIDGPAESGLLWECVKNLALSGVGSLTLLIGEDENSSGYHDAKYDDLGQAYIEAAKNELKLSKEFLTTNQHLLLEFITRLNPSIKVSTLKRQSFQAVNPTMKEKNDKYVCLSIDRSQSSQAHMSDLCRSKSIPYLSVESAGVFGRIFCDLGPEFVVIDPDGETPRKTLFKELRVDHDAGQLSKFILKSVEGERHDVSNGDIIQFEWKPETSFDDSAPFSMSTLMKVLKVHSPSMISVAFVDSLDLRGEDSQLSHDALVSYINKNADTFSRLKVSQTINFSCLRDALHECKESKMRGGNLFTLSDLDKSFDLGRREVTMGCFEALGNFASAYSRLPTRKLVNSSEGVSELDDYEKFLEFLSEITSQETLSSVKNERILNLFYNTCAGKLIPVQAFLGGIASQEVLKACSGLFLPIRQFLLYDAQEVLEMVSFDKKEQNRERNQNTQFMTGQDYVLGHETCSLLKSINIFVVGAGAIGCEILKNLAAMTRGSSPNGKIIVTDMDTIEKSNLSRQLLFREGNVGEFKSKAAEDAVKRFNPHMKLKSYTSKVGDFDSISTTFHERFWSKKVDVVLNALDNVPARLFIDSKCIEFGLAMIDAGTLGSKGNVQVVVPFESESYSSSADPPEDEIPVCTLKNFPYEISHTIQWARDLFDGLFNKRSSQLNKLSHDIELRDVGSVITDLVMKLGEDSAQNVIEEFAEDVLMAAALESKLHKTEPNISEEKLAQQLSLSWAIKLFKRTFQDTIEKLLIEHPPDSLDDDGQPFWSGTRRQPKVLKYNLASLASEDTMANQWIENFIRTAARLRYEMYASILKTKTQNQTWEASIETAQAELRNETCLQKSELFQSDKLDLPKSIEHLLAVINYLNDKSIRLPRNLSCAEFEKDDDRNGHVAFVTAASNLRALAYGIPPASALETRRVAGNIVPAMITTTAVVSALSCLELLKLVAAKASKRERSSLNSFRNAFLNLAQPFFAFTPPLPAEVIADIKGRSYTVWDRIIIKESSKSVEKYGGITLGQVKSMIKRKISSSVNVASITFGPFLIYANFLHGIGEEEDDLMKKSIWSLIELALRESEDQAEDPVFDGRDAYSVESERYRQELCGKSYLDLTVIVEDEESGEEIELPPVRIVKSSRVKAAT